MSTSAALDRVAAWKEGMPLPIGKTLGWPRAKDKDRLVLAFVRMAGESGPWGAAFGHPGHKPTILTVAEPRNADELAELGLKLWEGIKAHVPFRDEVAFAEGANSDERLEHLQQVVRERQLWLPGPSHVSMLHFLDYRYTTARTGDADRLANLNALGRACGWLFRESTRPGQVRVLDATRRLRTAFAFPAETPRQQHLGFLLGWLTSKGTREHRLEVAHRAEAQSVAITMDPELERDQLAPAVEHYREVKEKPAEGRKAAAKIEAILRPELERRYQLTVDALAAFDADGRPPNGMLDKVLDLGTDEFVYQYWNRETKAAAALDEGEAPRFLGSHPESDFHPPAAASRYFSHLHAAELTLAELVHGDLELQDVAIAGGDGLRGKITKVADEGEGRATVPVWTIVSSADGPLRLREGSSVCVAALRGREGEIRSLVTAGGKRTLTVVITGWKKARPDGVPDANDTRALKGKEVVLVAAGVVGLSQKKAFKVWDASGPGAWLTHAAPLPEPGPRRPPTDDLLGMVEKLGGR